MKEQKCIMSCGTAGTYFYFLLTFEPPHPKMNRHINLKSKEARKERSKGGALWQWNRQLILQSHVSPQSIGEGVGLKSGDAPFHQPRHLLAMSGRRLWLKETMI